MRMIWGTGVSNGIARGPLYQYRRTERGAARPPAGNREEELARLTAAQKAAAAQLEALADQCREQSEQAAILFETHVMLVEDEDFTACITDLIGEDCGAERAVEQAGEQFADLLAAVDDPYLRERSADIRDVARRILDHLMGVGQERIALEESVILCADDLSPSETLQLDREKLLGFVTREGSARSHTAILARTMGIPAICGVGENLPRDCSGHWGWMDGETGELILDPDAATRRALEEKYESGRSQAQRLQGMIGREDVSREGQNLEIFCNIGAPEDVTAVRSNDGRGIGLFRTEFLCLAAKALPGEEEQFAAYRSVAAAMEGKRVVIRTLDLGADKQADWFGPHNEENPALGLRGIRLCLTRPEILETQLRAIYRASVYGNVAILFPMITSLWEVRSCKEACRRVMDQLEAEGIPYDRNTQLGIMIETPAAVLMADELAREVDFFSVGTNDLTQYTLACDRQATDLGRFSDPRHPAILRSLKMAADGAHAAGIRIGICGDLGADPELLPLFLGMGIDEVSVPPPMVLPLREALRQSSAEKGRTAAGNRH